MKVAIVHEYLNQYGGAERVLEAIHEIYPDAAVYTLIYNPDSMPEFYKKWDIRESKFLKNRFIRKHYKSFFFIYPIVIEQFDLREYDLVISSSYAYAHGIITSPKTCHICFCHTPMRFVWVQPESYRQKISKLFRFPYDLCIHCLRLWDQSVSQRPDYYIAASQGVAQRIKRYYGRESTVINPPVDMDTFHISEKTEDYYLLVSRLVLPYKRIDIAIEAFNKSGKPFKIVGHGSEKSVLEKMSKPNIQFLGQMNSTQLSEIYAKCKALIFPGEDDFGIVPLEANACGRPVIAFRRGGILETQIENETAVYFDDPTVDSLLDGIEQFEKMQFNSEKIRESALRFDKKTFQEKIKRFVNTQIEEYKNQFQFKVIH